MLWRVKGVETVSVPPVQYLPVQSRKKNMIQARSEIPLYLGEPPWATEFMQWRMETGGGGGLFLGGVFFRAGCKLLFQMKVYGSHCVESWVQGPHRCEYLSHGSDVFLHASIVDGIVVCL